MRKLIIWFFLVFSIVFSGFSQSSFKWFVPISSGVQMDIPNGESVLGGTVGFGVNFSDQPNRWQLTLDLSKFSNQNLNNLSYHGFKSWTSSIKFGRMWESKITVFGKKLELGGGGMIISSLRPNVAPGVDRSVSFPGAGIYGRVFYPILDNNKLNLILEPSLFGEGFWRNQFGLGYTF